MNSNNNAVESFASINARNPFVAKIEVAKERHRAFGKSMHNVWSTPESNAREARIIVKIRKLIAASNLWTDAEIKKALVASKPAEIAVSITFG
jgi:hypothetical protein